MEFNYFTLMVTDMCNFRCSYCYQKRKMKSLDWSIIKESLDFFSPLFSSDCHVNFYGGEPLLSFDQIQRSINYIQGKNIQHQHIHYSLTTNGSLLNKKILDFLEKYGFSLVLSFDGLAQDIQRKDKSFDRMVSLIKEILILPGIKLDVNIVVIPETIGLLAKSIQLLLELGAPDILLSPSITSHWDDSSLKQLKEQLKLSHGFILKAYEKTGNIPLADLRKESGKGISACFAGKDRMILAPDHTLWGCHLFFDYFKWKEDPEVYQKYCFGDFKSFSKDAEKIHPEILANYSTLRMDHFYTSEKFCLRCKEISECSVCPGALAFSSSPMGKIPRWKCELNQFFRQEREELGKELENHSRYS